jgi:hypothetical protein
MDRSPKHKTPENRRSNVSETDESNTRRRSTNRYVPSDPSSMTLDSDILYLITKVIVI